MDNRQTLFLTSVLRLSLRVDHKEWKQPHIPGSVTAREFLKTAMTIILYEWDLSLLKLLLLLKILFLMFAHVP